MPIVWDTVNKRLKNFNHLLQRYVQKPTSDFPFPQNNIFLALASNVLVLLYNRRKKGVKV